MNKQEILNHKGWQYISSLSSTERHASLFGSQQSTIEKAYNVKIEERPFVALPDIKDEWVTISCTDSFRNISLIAVLIPN